MSRPLEIDVKAQVECSLRLTLEYLVMHAPMRELFTIQEMLSRHAADVAWQQSQTALMPLPKDLQEMPDFMRQQLVEFERQKRMQQEMLNYTASEYRQES
jgi:glucuronate isomerase